MEQSYMAWWFYGDDEGTFFSALFRNIVILGAGVVAAPVVIPAVKSIMKKLSSKSSSDEPRIIDRGPVYDVQPTSTSSARLLSA